MHSLLGPRVLISRSKGRDFSPKNRPAYGEFHLVIKINRNGDIFKLIRWCKLVGRMSFFAAELGGLPETSDGRRRARSLGILGMSIIAAWYYRAACVIKLGRAQLLNVG